MRFIPYKIWDTKNVNRIIWIALIVMTVLSISMAYHMYTVYTSPQFNSCVDLGKHIQDLNTKECIYYVNEHPYVTGQEIVDHFGVSESPRMISLEELLTSTMIP